MIWIYRCQAIWFSLEVGSRQRVTRDNQGVTSIICDQGSYYMLKKHGTERLKLFCENFRATSSRFLSRSSWIFWKSSLLSSTSQNCGTSSTSSYLPAFLCALVCFNQLSTFVVESWRELWKWNESFEFCVVWRYSRGTDRNGHDHIPRLRVPQRLRRLLLHHPVRLRRGSQQVTFLFISIFKDRAECFPLPRLLSPSFTHATWWKEKKWCSLVCRSHDLASYQHRLLRASPIWLHGRREGRRPLFLTKFLFR